MNKDITKVTINNVELDYNWFNMKIREKYMKCADEYAEKIDKLSENLGEELTSAEEIEYYTKVCEYTYMLFDDVFGSGTSDKIFKGEADFLACAEAVEILKDSRLEQQAYMEKFTKSMSKVVS